MESFYNQFIYNLKLYLFNSEFILRFIFSLIVIIIVIFIFSILRKLLDVLKQSSSKVQEQSFYYNKTLNIIMYFTILLGIITIWVENPWSFFIGIIGVGAIAFFAVWSILSNVLAGFLILLTNPFRIDAEITILPDNITGKVADFDLMFTHLKDNQGNIINIPHNLFFQKIIKTHKK
ncbi:MAG: mechanosensitive ion channel family protein [Candidatus Margulisbacteria bacterium]|nr:mechanosensitive ion channel family protein [Candidatus Margulisiibacteriota bacterium]